MNSCHLSRIRIFIACLLLTVSAISTICITPAQAITSSGWINENYSFENLELRRGIVNSTRHGRVHSCVLKGKIVNTSGKEKQNTAITFYAINIFDELLWESTIHIKSIPPFEAHTFTKKISCQDKKPYKWDFKVIESPQNPVQ